MSLKPEEIAAIFTRIAGIPHRLFITIGKEEAESYLYDVVGNYLVLSEFEPKLTNLLLLKQTQIEVRVSEVYDFKHLTYRFTANFREETEFNDFKAYLFKMPETIEVEQKPYEVIPDPGDHVTVTFRTRALQQFRKVTSLTSDELVFSGALPFVRELRGKRVEPIELKLPFRRVWTSGILSQVSVNTYKFRDYIQYDDDWNDLVLYATENYVQRNRLRPALAKPRESRPATGTVGTLAPAPEPLILIADDKPIITRVMRDLIEAKSHYRVLTTNVSTEVLAMAMQHRPDVILLDLHMPRMSGVEVARQIRGDLLLSRTPILFMTATGDREMELEAMQLAEVLEKPVETKVLLEKLADALHRQRGLNPVIETRIIVASDDALFMKNLPAGDWDTFTSPERVLYTDIMRVRAVFLRLAAEQPPALTLLNLLRAKHGGERLRILVQPRTESEGRLLSALQDLSLTLVPREMTAPEAAAVYLSRLV
jgi:CheY-like chemotaxis protein